MEPHSDMMIDMAPSHPHHEAHVTIAVLISILIATAGFHFLFYEYAAGLSLALFITILVVLGHILKVISGGTGNNWAYIFLIPIFISLVSGILYASAPTNAIGFLITIISLFLFTYWSAAPKRSLRDLKSLWPSTFFIESLFPFRYIGEYIGRIGKGKSMMTKILFGFLIAIPFLVIFSALFFTADPLFRKSFNDIFYSQSINTVLQRGIVDLIAVLFFTGASWAFVSRLMEKRAPVEPQHHDHIDTTILNTFLALLNLLFVAFIGFQFVYFFGGQDFIHSQGIVYSTYAREGFFQLLAVSVLVVALVIALYRFSNMKHWLLKGLTLTFIVQTGIILISAVRRLFLYVDAYGLTLSRYWAFIAIALIAVGLLFLIISIIGRFEIWNIEKYGLIGSTIVLSLLLLVNVEGAIANYNISQYMSGKATEIDSHYVLYGMSIDAVPATVAAYRLYSGLLGEDVKTNALKSALESYAETWGYSSRSRYLYTGDWRMWRVSDYRAITSLNVAGFPTTIAPQP